MRRGAGAGACAAIPDQGLIAMGPRLHLAAASYPAFRAEGAGATNMLCLPSCFAAADYTALGHLPGQSPAEGALQRLAAAALASAGRTTTIGCWR